MSFSFNFKSHDTYIYPQTYVENMFTILNIYKFFVNKNNILLMI